MAIANLNETIMAYKLRRNALNLQITDLHSDKRLATLEQLDFVQLTQARKADLKNVWKAEYEEGKDTIYADCASYTEIDEFEDAVEKIEAEYEIFMAELSAWETDLDNQIATADTELKEVEAYLESYESMLSENISNDFDYGIN